MRVWKTKLSTNAVLLTLNISLFIIQYVVFMTWFTRSKVKYNSRRDSDNGVIMDDTGVSSDEVFVYSNRLGNDLGNPGKVLVENVTMTTTTKEAKQDKSTWNWNWDGRGFTRPAAQRFLYLVRHGQYYGSGPYEKHLSPLGRLQAQKTGSWLRSLNVTFDRLVSSTSIRAAETADVIHGQLSADVIKLGDLDIEYSDELREGKPVFPDPAAPGMWNKDDPVFNLDGPRIKKAFEKFIHRADARQTTDTNEIIVTHGNIIAYTVLRVLQLPVSRWLKLGVLQGSATLLQMHPNGDVSLRILGDVGHYNKLDWSG